MRWRSEHRLDGVAALHSIGVPDVAEPTVRWCHPERPALVVGSAQPDSDVDMAVAAELGVEVVRRRSGGGAVFVEPGAIVWVDVLVPAGDPVWHGDVGKAFWWLGEAWAQALAGVGHPGAVVHKGGIVATRWSRSVCFAGLGPGEVTVDGRKVVGISQRRTRAGALFQCAVHRRFDAAATASLLRLGNADRRVLSQELERGVASVADVPAEKLERELELRLSSL